MRSHPLVNQHLITPLRALVKRLDTDTTNVPIFFVFDEISTLLVDKNDPTTYLALRRVTRLFSELPVWTFVLSTQSQLYHLTPAAAEDRSSRVSLRQLQLCEPFHAFPLDIEADRLLGEGKARQMALPLARFSEKEHVVTFGRPLWMAYKDESCQNICQIVRDKLLFTSEDYDPNKLDHLLAVLSSRISLDPCLQSERAVQLEQTGVDSHLRLILGYNVKLGCFNSIWPSEPLVAAASASVLMDDNDRKDLWAKSIKRMANKLFSPGLIDKGRTGELATRLLLVVAHDKLLKNAPVSTDFSSSRFQYSQHFSFVGFMHSLLKNSDQLLDSKASVRKAKKTVRKIFGNGSMNFSFFTTTDQPLTESRDAMAELLHNLMFTQAALQLCSNQKTWDLLLPIYLGDPEDDFNSNLLTALMIQVKNRQRNQPYIINKANHATFFPVGTPVITIILELGVEQGGISPIGSFRDDVFGFKISGLGTEIYECLEKAMVKPLKSLLAVSTAAIQDDVSSRNMRFRHHTWSDRFPSLNIHRKDIGADSELGETTAGSSPKSDHKRKRTMTAGDRKKNQKAKV